MQEERIITGNTEDEVWQKVAEELKKDEELLEYKVVLQWANRRTLLDIDIDLGGGFESGFESTMFSSSLSIEDDFRFAVHNQGFLDEVGKFFGMQDVVIGYPDFDKNFVIKTNDEQKVKAIFSDASVRETLQSLRDFTFGIIKHNHHHHKEYFLEFYSDHAIKDPAELRTIYSAFIKVLTLIDPNTN